MYLLGGPIIRTIVFWGLYWGPLVLGNYRLRFGAEGCRACHCQGVFLWTLRVCTLGSWVPKPWNMALNKGIWDPKLRGTNIKGTNLKS